MRKDFILLISLVTSLSISGCGDSSHNSDSRSIGAEIIQKYNYHVEGGPTTSSVTLPQQFTDANWGLKEITCKEAGYSLAPYAGENVSLLKYNLMEKYYPSPLPDQPGEPVYLWVLAKDQTTICGYLTVRENSGLIPGIISLGNPRIR